MDFSPSLPSIPRLRITRHSQLSPLEDDLSRTPTAGPSRLHVLQDESEDTDATPRLTVSSSLPSVYAVTEDTPAARLRALLAQVPNTSSASRTQLLHEPPPSLPSDRESDFEPPPRWANSSTNSSSARENLRSLFTHALRDPGDTPRKDARRNSIDLSEVEDTPRSGRVMEERARNKGKRMSFSDEELDKSSRQFGIRSPLLLFLTICPPPERKATTLTSHAANMQALRSHILNSHASQPSGERSSFILLYHFPE
jgi:serine/arginine repetitive matrix protein 2